jgi:hypothetical protein
MGNSTIKLTDMYDSIAARGIADPRQGPSGYGDKLALEMATATMADLVCDRFNWKWNSAVAAAFYTNSWQQDYPQPAQAGGIIGWGEDVTATRINDTSMPKPIQVPTPKWRRNLPTTSQSRWQIGNICWMYNKDLQLDLGVWPGANVTYQPLIGTGPTAQNPILYFVDVNGNILIVTTFGATGSVAPELPANSAEGTTVTDGSVVWTCVSPTSQGFRIDNLPSATAPVWQIVPTYQLDPPLFTTMQQKLDPIPDSFARYFRRGLESECLKASPNPGDMKRGEQMYRDWIMAMAESKKQGDREVNAYGLQPAGSVVEPRWASWGPYTADMPY